MLTCVKVERSGQNSEGVTPTSGFVKKWVILCSNVALFAASKIGEIGERKFLENKSWISTTKVR